LRANVGDILLAYDGLIEWTRASSSFRAKAEEAKPADTPPAPPPARTVSERRKVDAALSAALRSRVKPPPPPAE
jgi:hypothetical protein